MKKIIYLMIAISFMLIIPLINSADLVVNNAETLILGGHQEYTSVLVHEDGIIQINSTIGWLNLTATDNITIYGTIDGEGESNYSGGAGGTSKEEGCTCGFNDGNPGGTGQYRPGATGGTGGGGGGGCQGTPGGGGSGASIAGDESTRTNYEQGFGAGGGGSGGGDDTYYGCGYLGAVGSNGGAGIRLFSPTIYINGTISAKGGNGGTGGSGRKCQATVDGGSGGGGGGGGSAGTILLDGYNINISFSTLTTEHGSGGAGGIALGGVCNKGTDGSSGTAGKGGRIKIFYAELENSSLNVVLGTSGTIYYGSTEEMEVLLVSPSNDSSSPVTKDFVCNSSISTERNAHLTNVTFYLWNPDGSLNTTIVNDTVSGIFNQTTFTHTFTSDGAYTWNCLAYDNFSLNTFGENRTINVFTTAPSVNLNLPSDNNFFNSILNINFSYTPFDSELDSCKLYGNWTGTWEVNQTQIPTNNSLNSFDLLNLSEGSYIWNVWCNDTNGNENFAVNNYTFTIDTTFPSLTLDYITTTTGTQTFVFNSTTSDENDLTCKYSIFDLAGGIDSINENVTFVCNNETSATTSSYGTYNLVIYSTDNAGNENSSTLQFTTSATSGETVLGGGGSTTTIIEGNLAWTMEVAPGIALYEISMPVKSSRELGINFENLGGTSVNIELSCEDLIGNACQYVEFEEQNFELPLLKDTKTKATFTIILPDDAKEGDYQFNIRAKDQNGRNGVISVKLGIETSLLSNLRKLTLSTEGGIPYALFSIGILIVSIFIFSFGLPTKTFGKNLKPILVIVISLALSILPLYLI